MASDIAFDSGGNLFAWDETNLASDELATINLTTGVFADKGLSGLSSANDGLAFNGSALFVKGGNIFTPVNPATGIANVGGSISSVSLSGPASLIEALAFNSAGAGYSLGRPATGSNLGLYLFSGNLSSFSLVGFTQVEGLDSLAFSPDVVAAVPEPTSLLLLGTGVGAFVRRRRRAAAQAF